MVQSQAALVITGAIKGTSCDRLYQGTGPESLADRRWSCKIFFFHKIVNRLLPSYLQSYLNHYNDGGYLKSQHVKATWRLIRQEARILIRLFIHTLLKNNIRLVKKLET